MAHPSASIAAQLRIDRVAQRRPAAVVRPYAFARPSGPVPCPSSLCRPARTPTTSFRQSQRSCTATLCRYSSEPGRTRTQATPCALDDPARSRGVNARRLSKPPKPKALCPPVRALAVPPRSPRNVFRGCLGFLACRRLPREPLDVVFEIFAASRRRRGGSHGGRPGELLRRFGGSSRALLRDAARTF